ncbi:MAG: phosphoserine phosphatase RsbU/P [Acidobacteriota bacterium]|jgi:serine phosphatase RsbU (regulator of sigma subunit)|nr:phosphoserine phosphatase RsbU/P [Acidobacteriota bacterium]
MKRHAPWIACIAGIAALSFAIPRLNTSQPQEIRLTREEAKAIADREAVKWDIPVDKAWAVESWLSSTPLDKELDANPELRRAAMKDPVIGPRLGGYRVQYYRRGLEKFVPYGFVYVSASDGGIIAARRRARNETPGAQLSEAQLRPRADAFVASRHFAGAPNPQFESSRPMVQRGRTDWLFRYRVPSSFPTGKVVPYLHVSFIGDKLAGYELIEEYADGSAFRSDAGGEVAGTLAQFVLMYGLMLVLLVMFLRKYHAGEVGIGSASGLFLLVFLTMIGMEIFICRASTEGAGLSTAIDAEATAWAFSGFKTLFFSLPISLLVFLAWAVGESYARERWGERIGSFEALIRRDALNATVGRSTLIGLLAAPAVAGGALLLAAIAVVLRLAHPQLGSGTQLIVGLGGPASALLAALFEAIVYTITAVLFFLAFSSRRRALPVGIIAAILYAALSGALEVPIAPYLPRVAFGIGGIAVVIAIFLAYDLLAATVSMFFGSLLISVLPLLSVSRGDEARQLFMTIAIPLAVSALFAVAALMTRREVVYSYADLAPHVRRIVERERVKAEIDAANRIQAALLPCEAPIVHGATVSSHYRAATEIGGDYFDFLPQPSGEIGIAFGDVSGHGLTSGIVMAMAKSALLVQVDYDPSPRAVLNVLNEIVIRTAPKRILMTFFFGLLDPRTQILRFASAGHHDPYVYRAATQKLESLSSWGFPLGVRRRDPFREHSVSFEPGDRLILYSDGLIEAVDDDGNPFGFDRFEKTLLDHGTAGADDIKKALLNSVKKFTRNRPPEDDQTLVVVSFDDAAAASVQPPIVAAYSEHVN